MMGTDDEQTGLPQDSESDKRALAVKQVDALGLGELHVLDQIVRPYFEGHWKNQLEKSKIEIEFELKRMKNESEYRRRLMTGTFAVIFSVILLAFYLFWTGRDESAMTIMAGIVLVVTSSVAGYGWRAAKRSSISDDE